MLRKITQSPFLNLFSGLVLLVTSAYEIAISVDEAFIGVSHGILVFSIIQITKVIPEIMHGLTEIEEANEISRQRTSD